MRTNFYADACCVCTQAVAANDGFAEPPVVPGGRWRVKCKACAGVVEGAKPKVVAALEGANVAFKPAGFLGSDLFSTYRTACEGSRFDPAKKAQVANAEVAIKIVKQLQAAGFVVEITEAALATMQTHVTVVKTNIQQAVQRADNTDAILQARGLRLYPFQKAGIQWLTAKNNALLADDMGTGKSLQALLSLPENAAVLVIAPAVAKGVWKREVAKWRPEFKVTVLSGRGSFRWPTAGEILVTNYDVLPELPSVADIKQCSNASCTVRGIYKGTGKDICPMCGAKAALAETLAPGTILISDEAHVLKSSKTQRSVRFRALSEAVAAKQGKVWLLTATPLLNKPPELWNVFQAGGIATQAFGSWKNFVQLFNGNEGRFGMTWGRPTAEVASHIQRVCLRRRKVDVLPELPTKTYRSITVDINTTTRKACDKIAKLFDGALVNGKQMTLQQLSSVTSVHFEEVSRLRAMLAKAKIDALVELVEDFEEQQEPVVVFSAHLAPVQELGKREGWAVISGETPPDMRTAIENQFQAGQLKGIACTIKAGGVAITLTRASQAIFVDLEFTPALNAQAEDRINRIGQTRGVLITHVVADHILDERLFEILSIKQDLIDNSVEQAVSKGEVLVEVQELDFASLNQAVEAERIAEQQAKEAAEARVQQFAGARVAMENERNKSFETKRKEARQQRWMQEAKNFATEIRLAANAVEQWMAASLQSLADADPDRAREKNGVGFSMTDSTLGHKLAYLADVGLTNDQWKLAADLCRKYRKQVGEAPGA